MNTPPLPIDDVLPDLLNALKTHSTIILQAPTGAGKTTRIPLALHNDALPNPHRIVMLEPRRLAARAAATRMAYLLGEPVGQRVGYRIRFEHRSSEHTQVLVVTEGMFIPMIQEDPFLEDISHVILDEFHERNALADLSLAMTRKVMDEVRDDLKLIIMSATLDTRALEEAFPDAATITSQGRSYPVSVQYLPTAPSPNARTSVIAETTARGIRQLTSQTQRDTLVFLPGARLIHNTIDELQPWAQRNNTELLPLYSALSDAEQRLAISPTSSNTRRVILATNIAETSLTLPNIDGVVDSGLMKTMRFNPSTGLDQLDTIRISQANADQRTGRAGRVGPGTCLRLWTDTEHRTLPSHHPPEIHRVDLSAIALQLMAWGERDLSAFPWFEPPSPTALQHATELLELLGLIDASGVTSLGQRCAKLPLHPRLAVFLLHAKRLNVLHEASICAALLSERDILRNHTPRSSLSDLFDRLDLLLTNPKHPSLHHNGARSVLRIAKQLRNTAQPKPPTHRATPHTTRDQHLTQALLHAFPDRLAVRRAPSSPTALLVQGRGARLSPKSSVLDPPLFLALHIDNANTRSDALVHIASGVEPEWLPPHTLHERTELSFDSQTERIQTTRTTLYLDTLPIQTHTIPTPTSPETDEALLAAAQDHFERVIDSKNTALQSFITRTRVLHNALPDADIPNIDEAFLRGLLPTLCQGLRTFDELRKAPWLSLIHANLGFQTVQRIEALAPERIAVPSGSSIRLQYEEGSPVILPVRIQEMFGLPNTPTIAQGRIPLLLHLLAPNMRPQQVTQDLASFWANTYPDVRKELRQRYPKHAWPTDPLQASPERRPQRKKRNHT